MKRLLKLLGSFFPFMLSLPVTASCLFLLRKNRLLMIREKDLEEKLSRHRKALADMENFHSILTHDLQEPLRKIKNYGTLIQEKHLEINPEVHEYAARMISSAESMTKAINSLAELAAAEKRVLKKESVDLNQIISTVLTDLNQTIKATGAQIKVQPLPTVDADPIAMHQLFFKIVRNALQYPKPSLPPSIIIHAERVNDFFVQIMVQDNGSGIPAEYKDQIFNPHLRIEKGNVLRGTGLGLFICKKIVERHQGNICAESSEKLGTIIVVGLPGNFNRNVSIEASV